MLFKEIVDGRTDARTHGRTDDGRRTLKDHKSSLSTSCSGELKKIVWSIMCEALYMKPFPDTSILITGRHSTLKQPEVSVEIEPTNHILIYNMLNFISYDYLN